MGERTRSPRSLALMFAEHRLVHQTIHPHTPPQRRAGRAWKTIMMLYKNNEWQHRLPRCPWATAFAALQCGSISGLAVFPERKGNGISILAGMQMFRRVARVPLWLQGDGNCGPQDTGISLGGSCWGRRRLKAGASPERNFSLRKRFPGVLTACQTTLQGTEELRL